MVNIQPPKQATHEIPAPMANPNHSLPPTGGLHKTPADWQPVFEGSPVMDMPVGTQPTPQAELTPPAKPQAGAKPPKDEEVVFDIQADGSGWIKLSRPISVHGGEIQRLALSAPNAGHMMDINDTPVPLSANVEDALRSGATKINYKVTGQWLVALCPELDSITVKQLSIPDLMMAAGLISQMLVQMGN